MNGAILLLRNVLLVIVLAIETSFFIQNLYIPEFSAKE